MTNPVDTDALRMNAVEATRRGGDWGIVGQQLDDAADEVDRLRAVIENAPHAADCRAQFHGGDRYGNGGDSRYCICWKADAR